MNSDMVKSEKFGRLHLVYHFTVPLIKSVLTPLAITNLLPLGVTAAASATYGAVQNKIYEPDICLLSLAKQLSLMISNEEMKDIMKIVKSFQESGLLIKSVSESV